jgi:Tfp pilus assembly protein PilN
MIRVNLLPAEYRKAEATPLKQFFATVGAAIVVALAVVGWLYVRFGMLHPTQKNLETITDEVKAQEGQVKFSKDLAAWLGEYKSQYERIDKVAENRVLWSRKLDEFWDIVVSPKTPGKYQVWLKSLTCRLNPSAKSGGDIQFSGVSAGPQMFRMSDFNEEIKTSDFFREFSDITFPYGTKSGLEGDDREPKEGWTFTFSVTLRTMKELNEMRAKASKEAVEKK